MKTRNAKLLKDKNAAAASRQARWFATSGLAEVLIQHVTEHCLSARSGVGNVL
jgi:hypothetical protein